MKLTSTTLRPTIAIAMAFALAAACGGKKTPAEPKAVDETEEGAEGPSEATDDDQGDEAAADEGEGPKKVTIKEAADDDEGGDEERIEGPVANVNGKPIDAERFYAERDKITARGAKIPGDRMARIEANILKRLVEQELIDQAVEEAGVEVPAADLEEGFAEYKERFQSEEQFQNYLKHGRVTKEQIEDRIRDRRALELLLEKRGDLSVTEEEAREFYAKNERFYTEKAGVRASHILIKLPQNATPEDEEKAQAKVAEAQARLGEGDDFAEVAKTMSEGPSAPKGGDLGFFSEGRMVKEFQEAAFDMDVDEVSKEAVRTRFGFHIIKVTEKREDRKKAFDEVKEQIIKSLKNKKFFTERRKLLADLEKEAEIERFLPDPPPAPTRPRTMPGGHGHDHGPGGHDHDHGAEGHDHEGGDHEGHDHE